MYHIFIICQYHEVGQKPKGGNIDNKNKLNALVIFKVFPFSSERGILQDAGSMGLQALL